MALVEAEILMKCAEGFKNCTIYEIDPWGQLHETKVGKNLL